MNTCCFDLFAARTQCSHQHLEANKIDALDMITQQYKNVLELVCKKLGV